MRATLEIRCLEAVRSARTQDSSHGYPVQLEPILDLFGVDEVRERPIAGDARLILQGGSLVIEVNPALSAARRRLSIAHEIGHIVINQCLGLDRTHPSDGRDDTESLCNRLAAELLAPASAVIRYFDSVPALWNDQPLIRCSTILQAASAFEISVDAMTCRIFRDLRLLPQTVGIVWRHMRSTDQDSSHSALRIASVWHSVSNLGFVPLNKTAPSESVVCRASREPGVFVENEDLKIGGLKGFFMIEAAGFGVPRARTLPSRSVLSLIRPYVN